MRVSQTPRRKYIFFLKACLHSTNRKKNACLRQKSNRSAATSISHRGLRRDARVTCNQQFAAARHRYGLPLVKSVIDYNIYTAPRTQLALGDDEGSTPPRYKCRNEARLRTTFAQESHAANGTVEGKV